MRVPESTCRRFEICEQPPKEGNHLRLVQQFLVANLLQCQMNRLPHGLKNIRIGQVPQTPLVIEAVQDITPRRQNIHSFQGFRSD